MRLPILVLSEFSFAARWYVKSSPSWPHESLWCKLAKFSRWNGLTANDLTAVFSRDITAPRALLEHPRPKTRRKLLHHLAMQKDDLNNALPPEALQHWRAAISRSLRGCPECYRRDFHSPLFQVTVIRRCPMHGDELVTGCPACAFPQPYAVSAQWRRDGPVCGRCGRPLLRTRVLSAGLTSRLVMLRRWRECIAMRLRQFDPYAVPPRTSWLAWLALREWSHHYAEVLPAWPTQRSDSGVVPIVINSRVPDEAELYRVAMRHYYVIRRIWRGRLDRPVRRAVALVMQGRTRHIPPSPKHEDALALILWRLIWERRATASRRVDGRADEKPTMGVILWIATRPLALENTSQPTAIEAFDRELANSYASCRALATWMSKRSNEFPPLPTLLMLFSASYLGWKIA